MCIKFTVTFVLPSLKGDFTILFLYATDCLVSSSFSLYYEIYIRMEVKLCWIWTPMEETMGDDGEEKLLTFIVK